MARKKKTTKEETVEIKTEELKARDVAKFLKRISLGNLLEEVLIVVKDDNCYCQAVDVSASIFLKCWGSIGIKDEMEFGLRLQSLISFLNSIGDEIITTTISKEGNRLIINRKGHGDVKFVLSDKETIATKFEEDGACEKLLNETICSLVVPDELINDLKLYMALKPTTIIFTIKNGNLILSGGSETENQFTTKSYKVNSLEKKDMVLSVFGEHFMSLINTIYPKEKNEIIYFHFTDSESPLLVVSEREGATASDLWAFEPMQN